MQTFDKASDEEIVRFLIEHQDEMDTEGYLADSVLKAIAEGRMVVEREKFAAAIVEPEACPGWKVSPCANLFLLYVLPQGRNRGYGRDFVKALIEKHSGCHPVCFNCNGCPFGTNSIDTEFKQ